MERVWKEKGTIEGVEKTWALIEKMKGATRCCTERKSF